MRGCWKHDVGFSSIADEEQPAPQLGHAKVGGEQDHRRHAVADLTKCSNDLDCDLALIVEKQAGHIFEDNPRGLQFIDDVEIV